MDLRPELRDSGGKMLRYVIAAGCVGVLGTALAGSAIADAKADKGKAVYAAAMPKCKTCHSIAGEGNAKGALDDVGKLSADDIKAWIRTPKEMTEKAKATRKPAMPAYGPDKINDATLEALTAYLSSLK